MLVREAVVERDEVAGAEELESDTVFMALDAVDEDAGVEEWVEA